MNDIRNIYTYSCFFFQKKASFDTVYPALPVGIMTHASCIPSEASVTDIIA